MSPEDAWTSRSRWRMVTVLAVALAGCGGDDRLGMEEFAERADAICADVTASLDAVPTPGTGEELSAWVEPLDRVIQISEDGRRRLGDLKPPGSDQGAFDDVLEEIDEGIEHLRAATVAAGANDLDSFRAAVQRADEVGDPWAELLPGYEFRECGEGKG